MYRAPLQELAFVLNELLGAQALSACPEYADYSAQLAGDVIEEAARFAENVLEPLNQPGDREGAHWSEAGVTAPQGFREAYRQFVEAGWPTLAAPQRFGGQGVPHVLSVAVQELWGAANLSFKLCPMLTQGAVEALVLRGSEAQQRLYLPKMVRGEWTGTMVLTEPQAGSDLGLIRTRAVAEGDHYRLYGQKIFITWGEHDCAENIIHMVLARIDGAPPSTRGISLFIVPKVLVNADGSPGARNDVRCVSIEHKLGIHASPTCVMAFGENEGALGYLVGEPHHGLEYMFIMMNAARLSVGLEGYAVAERALQRACEWARERRQGRAPAARGTGNEGPAAIMHHPDVKRMLLTMKSGVEAMRALTLYTALQLDFGAHHPDAQRRAAAQARGELLIPIVKGWCTELGIEIASIGIQVHGGMGYIEETGAAQYLRDARITAIYEGTSGIQSGDLVGRKIGRDGGRALRALIDDLRSDLVAQAGDEPAAQAAGAAREPKPAQGRGDSADVQAATDAAREALDLLEEATTSLLQALAAAPERALAVAMPYLKLCGFVIGGALMAKSAALAAAGRGAGGAQFHAAKRRSAGFYAAQLLPRALALHRIVCRGADSVVQTGAEMI